MTRPAAPPPTASRAARRGRRLVPLLGTLAGAALIGGLAQGSGAASAEPLGRQEGDDAPIAEEDLVAAGRALYMTSCVSCHGADGRGQDAPNGQLRGPTLEDTGEAGAYYQLSTGRMPLGNPDDVPQRKEPAFATDEIEALVAYVGTLTDGPERPTVTPADGDLAVGGELYRENCQACHSATGAGGALSYGRAAPPLAAATPPQIGAAVRSGPGPMPRFGPDILGDEELDSVARYVEYLDEPDDRGGLALGRLGPIPEGFLVWVGGLGLLLVLAFWMGTRRAQAIRVDPIPPDDPGTRGDGDEAPRVDAPAPAEEARP